VTIYGDGRQVRDVLWIDDLLDAYELAISGIDEVRGRVYNLGGGPAFTLSLLELLDLLKTCSGKPLERRLAPGRSARVHFRCSPGPERTGLAAACRPRGRSAAPAWLGCR
jgi:nucleoside-diphosphate-sugar epimerase